MKSINTYRKVAAKILRKLDKPIDKPILYKLSHFLDKYEKSCHTGPDQIKGHFYIDELVDKFIAEKGPEGIQAKFEKYCENR